MHLLDVRALSKHFGGIRAIEDVSFSASTGTILSIIGPNGAGKTTLFNLITGVLRPTAGSILFDGQSITGLNSWDICKLGIARTFQAGRPFANMTVYENVLVGIRYGREKRRLTQAETREAIYRILDLTGLAEKADYPVRSLNLVDRKISELARSLATRPAILLLDEPLAGLNPADLKKAVDTIVEIKEREGVTVLWVEHVMKALMGACEHIIALSQGTKIAEGTPAEVTKNENVIAAYLGTKRG